MYSRPKPLDSPVSAPLKVVEGAISHVSDFPKSLNGFDERKYFPAGTLIVPPDCAAARAVRNASVLSAWPVGSAPSVTTLMASGLTPPSLIVLAAVDIFASCEGSDAWACASADVVDKTIDPKMKQ